MHAGNNNTVAPSRRVGPSRLLPICPVHQAVHQARKMASTSDLEIVPTTPRRGVNYVKEEDIAITRAYIYVSTDAIVGSDQVEGTYYTRIWEVYKTKKPGDIAERPMTSVQTRLKAILKESVRFSACFKTVKNMNKSGHTEDDDVRLSTAMFNQRTVSHPREDVGKPFRFLPC